MALTMYHKYSEASRIHFNTKRIQYDITILTIAPIHLPCIHRIVCAVYALEMYAL